MSSIEHKTHFINRMKRPTKMLLDASTRGTLRGKKNDEVKNLTENMCQNEYRSSDQAVKQNGIIAVDLNTISLAQMEVL